MGGLVGEVAVRAVILTVWGLVSGEMAMRAGGFLMEPVAVGVELVFDEGLVEGEIECFAPFRV